MRAFANGNYLIRVFKYNIPVIYKNMFDVKRVFIVCSILEKYYNEDDIEIRDKFNNVWKWSNFKSQHTQV